MVSGLAGRMRFTSVAISAAELQILQYDNLYRLMVGLEGEPHPVDVRMESLASKDNGEHLSLNVRVTCLTVTE